MKVILTPDMAKELLENEEMIKNQEGPYRPHFNPVTKKYESVIKCWPLEEYAGGEIQQRDVIPGMESDVDDICMAKINNGTISYRVNKWKWYPSYNPFTRVMETPQKLLNHSVIVYTPTFENDTIFLTAETLDELYERMKTYHLSNDNDDDNFDNIDEWFQKYQGICTYILLEGDNVVKCGKFENKKYW